MLILVAGLPGSGKSYFAERLAARLRATYLSSDRVRAAMKARRKYAYDERMAVYSAMAATAAREIETGKDVLVDATFFDHAVREPFLKIAQVHAVPMYIIEITADEALIRERMATAREFSEADFGVYEMLRDNFEKIATPHITLVSTNDNIDDMLQRAIRYLGNDGR